MPRFSPLPWKEPGGRSYVSYASWISETNTSSLEEWKYPESSLSLSQRLRPTKNYKTTHYKWESVERTLGLEPKGLPMLVLFVIKYKRMLSEMKPIKDRVTKMSNQFNHQKCPGLWSLFCPKQNSTQSFSRSYHGGNELNGTWGSSVVFSLDF